MSKNPDTNASATADHAAMLTPVRPVHDIPPLSGYSRSIIDRLGLQAHPEGGWYVRDWQSPSSAPSDLTDATRPGASTVVGNRPLASLIYFLLPQGDYSDWHRVDADELWLWHGPGTVTLELAGDGNEPDPRAVRRITLGEGLRTATLPVSVTGHAIVPAGIWQRTIPGNEDALVSCVVSPGFTFNGFTLADRAR